MVGKNGSIKANNAIKLSDCIICIGTSFDNINMYPLNTRYIIHINIDNTCFNKKIKDTINIHGDANLILHKLYNLLNKIENREYINELNIYTKYFNFLNYKLKQQDIFIYLDFLLNNMNLKKDIIITSGNGNYQIYIAQYIQHIYPNRFITNKSLNTICSSISLAIGCKLSNANKIIISIDDSESFQISNDLLMIINYNIPIKIIIFNNEKKILNNNINYEYISKAYNIEY